MTDPSRWSLDRDPPRDASLARVLRLADAAPGTDVDWDRLHEGVIRRATSFAAGAAGAAGGTSATERREWWDVVVQWRRLAAAASVAAILGAGALIWASGRTSSESAVGDDTAPELVALARVVAAYPDDAVFTSLLQADGADELGTWEDR